MKKWVYLLSGVLIGAIVATSGDAFAAQVKSLIGQKVSGELKVVVNGKELASNGAVINGVTNAPIRALSDALGANLQLEGKVINITTDMKTNDVVVNDDKVNVKKTLLLTDKATLEKQIAELQEQKKIQEGKLAKAAPGMEQTVYQNGIDSLNKQITEKTEALNKVNAELQALK
ncbi:hypothetical protein J2Z69_000782 [Paenibacillus shirakamiensis]|uniref:Copper amine oxidase n=1 Tax=Paenibacillus shirakamiensis TaxID=1265935 RepID=A0ABS4JDH1_9BACL|nr:2,' 3'-cyclic nucleotide 2'-phosphodiesterase [Paenibacillus shirakamiensis]MBP1999763.1 hypothetical protein [Paenibacillus shirakamiensis]